MWPFCLGLLSHPLFPPLLCWYGSSARVRQALGTSNFTATVKGDSLDLKWLVMLTPTSIVSGSDDFSGRVNGEGRHPNSLRLQ